MSSTTRDLILSGPGEAFAAIALAAVACDGELSTLEARALRQQLEYRQPFRNLDDGAMAALLDRLLRILRQRGCEALVREAAPLLQAQQRQTAYAVAVALTGADHVETAAERLFLQQLALELAIPAERASTILEVIRLLTSDSLAGSGQTGGSVEP